MNQILPWTQQLIESAVFTRTCLAFPATAGTSTIEVNSLNWFSAGQQIVIEQEMVSTITAIDPETHTLTLAEPLPFSAQIGSDVRKIRAANPPAIYIGTFDGAVSPPAIRISGDSLTTDPLTIGGVAFDHVVHIDVMTEQAKHTDSHLDMVAIAKDVYQILFRHRSFTIGNRWFYNAMPEIDYGTMKGTTLQAARITWTMKEEYHVVPDPSESLTAVIDYDAKQQELEGLLTQILQNWRG